MGPRKTSGAVDDTLDSWSSAEESTAEDKPRASRKKAPSINPRSSKSNAEFNPFLDDESDGGNDKPPSRGRRQAEPLTSIESIDMDIDELDVAPISPRSKKATKPVVSDSDDGFVDASSSKGKKKVSAFVQRNAESVTHSHDSKKMEDEEVFVALDQMMDEFSADLNSSRQAVDSVDFDYDQFDRPPPRTKPRREKNADVDDLFVSLDDTAVSPNHPNTRDMDDDELFLSLGASDPVGIEPDQDVLVSFDDETPVRSTRRSMPDRKPYGEERSFRDSGRDRPYSRRDNAGMDSEKSRFKRMSPTEKENKALVLKCKELRQSGQAAESILLFQNRFTDDEALASVNSFVVTEWLCALRAQSDVPGAMNLYASLERIGFKMSSFAISAYIAIVKDTISPKEMVQLLKKNYSENPEEGPDHTSFNGGLSIAARSGDFTAAKELFDFMMNSKGTKIKPDVYSFTNMINACAEANEVSMAESLYASMKDYGVQPNAMTKNVLLKVFARMGDTSKLKAYFRELFDFSKPSAETGSSVFEASDVFNGEAGSDDEEESEAAIPNAKEGPDDITFSTIFEAFAREGNVDAIYSFLQEVTTMNESVLVAILNGFAQSSRGKVALELFHKFTSKDLPEDERVAPSVMCYNAVINALARSKETDAAIDFFVDMRMSGEILPNEVTYNTLVSMFASQGEVAQAMEVMKHMKQDHVRPSLITFTSLLNACAEGKRPELADAVLKEMRGSGVEPDIACMNAVLKARAVCGHMRDARVLFDEIGKAKKDPVKKNAISYNTMIWLYSNRGKLDEALALVDAMIENGVNPDDITFSIIFNALNLEKKGWLALKLYRKYHSYVVASPSMVTYTALLRSVLFTRERNTGDIEGILKDMREAHLIRNDAMYNQLYMAFVAEDGTFRLGLKRIDDLRREDRRKRRRGSGPRDDVEENVDPQSLLRSMVPFGETKSDGPFGKAR
eukprot:CAMPEP_0184697446 /NCGR_PEP_ID=MMETSP0313-20130426/4418_1 /TAXON_ID=2792 /ORGANISM="Porphyridium aerugineum, Strain SAG 1380-2" /LENGTH=960 /DNA_ID=CAMNT_0027156253 /DNA_START=146 /DNA_END=3028 /DNA_ORIENTATION=+